MENRVLHETNILGIRIYKEWMKCLIEFIHSTYSDKILKRFNMANFKKGDLFTHHIVKLRKAQCPSSENEIDIMSRVPYVSAIWSIMYVMNYTHSDVCYTLNMVSRYLDNLGRSYWTTVKSVDKYLWRMNETLLVFSGKYDLRVSGYSDVNFQIDWDNLCTQYGWVFLLNGGLLTYNIGYKLLFHVYHDE